MAWWLVRLPCRSWRWSSPDSVPAAGERVLIRLNANLDTGGTAADITDRVHPEVAVRAIEAARIIGLDIAGVDIVALDIGRPLEEQGGVIVEVNAGPGLRMHLRQRDRAASRVRWAKRSSTACFPKVRMAGFR